MERLLERQLSVDWDGMEKFESREDELKNEGENSERVISIVKKNSASREEQSHEEIRKLMRSNAKPGWRGS